MSYTSPIECMLVFWTPNQIDEYLSVIKNLLNYVWEDDFWIQIEKGGLFNFRIKIDDHQINLKDYLRKLLDVTTDSEELKAEKKVAFLISLNYSHAVKIMVLSQNKQNFNMGCYKKPKVGSKNSFFYSNLHNLTKKLEEYKIDKNYYLNAVLQIWVTGMINPKLHIK